MLTQHGQQTRGLTEQHRLCTLSSSVGNRQLTITPSAFDRISRQTAAEALAAPSCQLRGTTRDSDVDVVRYRMLESGDHAQQRWNQPKQRALQPQAPLWGYLAGTDADQWTWDDDYNPSVRVSSGKSKRRTHLGR